MTHDAIHVAHQLLRLADVVDDPRIARMAEEAFLRVLDRWKARDEGDARQAFIGARPFTSRWHLT